MAHQQKACAICGKSSSLVCGQCKSTNYCSRACQKQHWKYHKKSCGKPVFSLSTIAVGDKCTRCLQVIQADASGNPVLTGCKVPHPEHMQRSQGSMGGPEGMMADFACLACRKGYRRSSADNKMAPSEAPITVGPAFCFEGNHTLLPIELLGDCRVQNDLVVIKAGPNMQAEIDALDGNDQVTVLRICSPGFYSSEDKPSLNIKLPNLKELQLEDVGMKQIHLTPELTPNVEVIFMQNPTEDLDPDFVIQCPKLKKFSCYYWGRGNPEWLNVMLEHATELEFFDSYKLRVDYLKFASNQLDFVRLHRCDCLEYLELYAPRLTKLDVQAAYDLEEIVFRDTHPVLTPKLPANFQFSRELEVNAVNACLGQVAKRAISNHPRFRGELEDDEGGMMAGNPMEGFLRQLFN